MGKGTIISHAGDGLYNITLNLDTARALAEYAKLATVIPAIEAAIEDIEDEIETLRNELSLIDPFKHVDDYVSKLNELQHKNKEKNRTTLLLASAQKRYQVLGNNIPADPAIQAWCADKTTGLSGEVGIIEVPGERKTLVNIQPGYGGNAAYSSARDGQLQPSISGLVNNIFFNWALLPGWQKWMPTYRYGTITSIDTEEDKCNVTLEAATSSVKGENNVALNVNAVDALEDVPIVYMDVDGEAFAVGDVVLIKFDSVKADIRDAGNWANCTVIGFKDHPKYPEVAGIPLVYEVRDIDWNIIGYVKAKSTLEPDPDQILPADPPPTFATVIANAGSFVIDVGTSVYLGDLHYQRISTITLNSVVIKTFQIDGYLIEGTYLYTGEWLSGSGSCVYHDEDHYIYRYTIYKYDGTAPFSAPSSVENYLNINGTEIKIADSSLGQGYIDYAGYLLPDFDYRIGIFNNGTDFYYIFSVNWYNDDDQSWWEFFYKKNDDDLIRWTGPISEDWEFEYNMPLGFQIDGVDAYCWDGSVGIIIS